MQISISRPEYIIPSYSLTGDLLAYLKCGLQYRYHNKGSLPPSKPVQLWFGEFIHAVMEESYLRWDKNITPLTFPWNWEQHIRPIELEIARRLRARNLHPPYQLFCGYPDTKCTYEQCPSNHQLLASRRVEAAINTWGAHLFPLISQAEIRLQGIRPMPTQEQARADYYEVTGIADVIGSVQLTQSPRGNLLLHYLNNDSDLQRIISNFSGESYEIILDYKGMRRPSVTSPVWQHYAWQVMTYAWLRQQQPDSVPVIAGIVLFLNELDPSKQDIKELQQDVRKTATDIMPSGRDLELIRTWGPKKPAPALSTTFLECRSLRIIVVDLKKVEDSLHEFDYVVDDIEHSVLNEMGGCGIVTSWRERPSNENYVAPERRTCTACDFKYHCSLAPKVGEGGAPLAP